MSKPVQGLFEHPSSSTVGGFLGWIHYTTPIELFACTTGAP